jgi:hypothetical protein
LLLHGTLSAATPAPAAAVVAAAGPRPTHILGVPLEDCVNSRATNKAGGDRRVKLSGLLSRLPPGFTGVQAHGLAGLQGVKFYHEAAVRDSDDPGTVYR